MNASTKIRIINIAGFAFSIAGLVFLIMAFVLYNSSTNLSFDFFALAFTLMFIILFIILPMSSENYFDQ